eukprot:gene832-3584_t
MADSGQARRVKGPAPARGVATAELLRDGPSSKA